MGKKNNVLDVRNLDRHIPTNDKYEKFRWFAEWLEFEETLPDIDDRAAFNMAIKDYGLSGIVRHDLHGAALEYFNTHVRPELDRQHKRLEKGLWI